MLRLSTFLVLAIFLTGCIGTSMPRETAMMSAEMGPRIKESEKSHRAMLKNWIMAEREKIEILLHYHWIPNFIKDYLNGPAVKKAFKEEVCKSSAGKMDRALVIQELMEDLTMEIEAERNLRFGEVADWDTDSRKALEDHYDDLNLLYNSVNANVHTVQKGLEMEKHIRAAMERPLNKIIPVRKVRKGFDNLFELGE